METHAKKTSREILHKESENSHLGGCRILWKKNEWKIEEYDLESWKTGGNNKEAKKQSLWTIVVAKQSLGFRMKI